MGYVHALIAITTAAQYPLFLHNHAYILKLSLLPLLWHVIKMYGWHYV